MSVPNFANEESLVSDLKTSKFNSAGLLNLTLHELWKECRTHARAGLYNKWNDDLDMIWGELGGDLNPKDTRVKDYNELCLKIYECGSLFVGERIGFNKPNVDFSHRAKQYLLLLQKHLWLKRLQNELGKGTAYRDEFEDDFE